MLESSLYFKYNDKHQIVFSFKILTLFKEISENVIKKKPPIDSSHLIFVCDGGKFHSEFNV